MSTNGRWVQASDSDSERPVINNISYLMEDMLKKGDLSKEKMISLGDLLTSIDPGDLEGIKRVAANHSWMINEAISEYLESCRVILEKSILVVCFDGHEQERFKRIIEKNPRVILQIIEEKVA